MNCFEKYGIYKSGIKSKFIFYTCLAIFFNFHNGLAQDQIICDSEFNFFGVDIDENNGNGSTNSTYDWFVYEDEFAGEIIPQTSSGNQIIIEWQNTPGGVYTILVQEMNSDFECEADPQQMVIQLKDLHPEDILGPTYVCEGETIALDHPFKESGKWTLDNKNIGRILQNGNFEAWQSGTVNVNLSYENDGCEFSVSKFIQVNPKPKPILKNSEICIDAETGEKTFLDSGLSGKNYEFRWYHNNNKIDTSNSSIVVSEVGEYKLEVVDSETGCMSDAISARVVQLIKPAISVSVHTDFNNTQRIVVHIPNPENYLFKLENGRYQDSHIFENITREGKHQISIMEKEGCFTKDIEAIVINYPKFFTPNGDGFNDTWNIFSLEDDSTAEIFIYDRFGKFLKTISPSSEGWDGMYNGKKMPSDDYWFKVEYTGFNDGSPMEFLANFTLKR